MSFFKKDTANTAEPIITVSAETIATVSDRVKFESQIVEFEADSESSKIALVTRANTQDLSNRNKKGLVLKFDKTIKSGKYLVTDQNFPFDAYYFETGTIPGFSTSFQYKPQSGYFSVETVENSAEKLHYEISFDFKGVSNRNKELTITGKSTYIVLIQA